MLKCGQRELDLVKNYTGHEYDQVLDQYYAKNRMYDAGDKRFIAVDPVKGSLQNPMSMVQYLYCLNNPVNVVDPLGLMAKEALNTLKNLYLDGKLSEENIATLVLVINVFGNSQEMISAFDEADLLEGYTEFGNKPSKDQVTNASIYIAFHEITQILAAKEIYLARPKNVEIGLLRGTQTPYPDLEKRVENGEADIILGDRVWEVKPGHYSKQQFSNALERYTQYGYEPGYGVSMKEAPHVRLFTLANIGKVYLTYDIMPNGRIGYYFKIECDNGTYNPDVLYKPVVVAPPFAKEAQKMKDSGEIALGAATLLAILMADDWTGVGIVNDLPAAAATTANTANWLKSSYSLLKTLGLVW